MRGRLGAILTGSYRYSVGPDQSETFQSETDAVTVPRTHPISLRQLLYTSYSYHLLDDGTEAFCNREHTIYVHTFLKKKI